MSGLSSFLESDEVVVDPKKMVGKNGKNQRKITEIYEKRQEFCVHHQRNGRSLESIKGLS